jgi:hypothetical protein
MFVSVQWRFFSLRQVKQQVGIGLRDLPKTVMLVSH